MNLSARKHIDLRSNRDTFNLINVLIQFKYKEISITILCIFN